MCNNKLSGHLSSDIVIIQEQLTTERMFLPAFLFAFANLVL